MRLLEISNLMTRLTERVRRIPSCASISLATRIGFFLVYSVIVLVASKGAHAAVSYDRHVFFDNSLPELACYQSRGTVVAPSELELAGGKFPVDAEHFVTPPNGLRLKWKSAPGGEWRMKLSSMARYGRNLEFEGDTLSVWCFSEKPLLPDEAPRINLQEYSGLGSGATTLLASYGPLPAGKWVRLDIPLESFKNQIPSTEDVKFTARNLDSIWFVQGLDDGKEHTIYLDDFRICRRADLEREPPAAPTGLIVKGFERHYDLT